MEDKASSPRGNKRVSHLRKLLLAGLVLVLYFVGDLIEQKSKIGNAASASLHEATKVDLGAFPILTPNMRWGFALDTFTVREEKIKANQVLGSVLNSCGLSPQDIDQLVQKLNGRFEYKSWRTGKGYAVLSKPGQATADYIIYEPNAYEYYLFDLKNLDFELVKRPVIKETITAEGMISSSLWKAMTDAGMSFELADKMEDALQWSVDFHHTQANDKFKLLYEQDFVEGKKANVGRLFAAHYQTGDQEFHAIYFEDKEHPGYYDLEGRPMNKGFLKSPVKYARISSGYNLKRFHPILKYTRPHFGTDYAAPAGTPILSVGNGVVVEAAYGKGNGNFVKIKHDDTYTTQYLHMQGFAKGIRKGAYVQQGQVIGYVGSTGLATGPHVCFRFWKNGQQVNHLKLNFPPPKPLPQSVLPQFFKLRDQYLEVLHQPDQDVADKLKAEQQNPEPQNVIGNP